MTNSNKLFVINYLIVSLLFFSQSSSFAQETNNKLNFDLEFGYHQLFNRYNDNEYLRYKSSRAVTNYNTTLGGADFKLVLGSKWNNIDWVLGGTMVVNRDDLNNSNFTPGRTNSDFYGFNGGGIYGGIRPKFGSNTVGLNCLFAIGVFSFKEYTAIYNNINEPFVDENIQNASSGLGAKGSLGAYLKIGRFGISPSVDFLFSGGANTSFLFYGFTLPLTMRF